MVAIGVTGHRKLENLEEINAAIEGVLETIQHRFDEGISTVVSPLAEGADRLVAKRAIDLYSAKLIVPLPFEMADYMLDFETSESKLAFTDLTTLAAKVIELPEKESREQSYLAAGRYMVEHCDVLVAIWDGAPPRGIGGTGQIVEEARNRSMPIAWIQVGDQNRAGCQGASPICIQYERFPIDEKHQGGNL